MAKQNGCFFLEAAWHYVWHKFLLFFDTPHLYFSPGHLFHHDDLTKEVLIRFRCSKKAGNARLPVLVASPEIWSSQIWSVPESCHQLANSCMAMWPLTENKCRFMLSMVHCIFVLKQMNSMVYTHVPHCVEIWGSNSATCLGMARESQGRQSWNLVHEILIEYCLTLCRVFLSSAADWEFKDAKDNWTNIDLLPFVCWLGEKNVMHSKHKRQTESMPWICWRTNVLFAQSRHMQDSNTEELAGDSRQQVVASGLLLNFCSDLQETCSATCDEVMNPRPLTHKSSWTPDCL